MHEILSVKFINKLRGCNDKTCTEKWKRMDNSRRRNKKLINVFIEFNKGFQKNTSKGRTEIKVLILSKIVMDRIRRRQTSCELNRLGKQKHGKFVNCIKMTFFPPLEILMHCSPN